MSFRAVIFDWRGTLVTTLSEHRWVQEALALIGRDATTDDVDQRVRAIRTASASGDEDRLEGPGVDSDADRHRRTYLEVFHAAGFGDTVEAFILSFEQGIQKPDPRIFHRTLTTLGVGPDDTLMVGDRCGPDGAAVEAGINTAPPPADRRPSAPAASRARAVRTGVT